MNTAHRRHTGGFNTGAGAKSGKIRTHSRGETGPYCMKNREKIRKMPGTGIARCEGPCGVAGVCRNIFPQPAAGMYAREKIFPWVMGGGT